jgi:enoyl-CoA hydratase
MINQVTSREDLLPVAIEIAEKIARNSPTAVQAVKYAARAGQGQPLEQAIAVMDEAHWVSAVHPDRIEGAMAWFEGREPVFPDPNR